MAQVEGDVKGDAEKAALRRAGVHPIRLQQDEKKPFGQKLHGGPP